jgi:hypothetical protein
MHSITLSSIQVSVVGGGALHRAFIHLHHMRLSAHAKRKTEDMHSRDAHLAHGLHSS